MLSFFVLVGLRAVCVVGCVLLYVVCCMQSGVGCMVYGVWWLLFVVCCLVCAGRGVLCVV